MTDKIFQKDFKDFLENPLNNGTNEGEMIKDFEKTLKTFKKLLTNEKTCATITV